MGDYITKEKVGVILFATPPAIEYWWEVVVRMKGEIIPDEVIDSIRKHYDILDLVGRYVQLKRRGRNYFGLCPFHSEKTPSFSVAPDKQIYYCFGCAAGGDVIRFVMEIEGITFVEAVRQLGEQAGIPIPSNEKPDPVKEDIRIQMRKALELAAQVYHYILMNNKAGGPARKYLRQRGVQLETVKEFQLGFAPVEGDFLLEFMKRRGIQERILEEAGLIVPRDSSTGRTGYYDRFRGRVLFPIHDTQGRVIGFGGRALGEGKPKYLNSPETLLFRKKNHLFNLHRARRWMRKEQQTIILEGYMDVIAVWQAGIKTGIATLGTALTEEQARIIRRNAETAIICYDADEAGQSAAMRGLELLASQQCIVKVGQMPHNLDPDDYIRKYGAEAFRTEVIGAALSFTAFKLETLKKGLNLQDESQRMKYLLMALEVISDLPLAIERDHYLRLLAKEFHISLDALKQELRQISARKRSSRDKARTKWHNEYHRPKHMVDEGSPTVHEEAERQLLARMIRDKEVAQQVLEVIGADFPTDVYAAIAAHLYAYYAANQPQDPGKFIATLKDEQLVQKASELVMMEIPEKSAEEIADYIRHIRNYPIHIQIESKKKEIERAERAGNITKAVQLGIEVIQLRKKMKKQA